LQTTVFGLLMSARCENINRVLDILKYQLRRCLDDIKEDALRSCLLEFGAMHYIEAIVEVFCHQNSLESG
jgi:hypothetical protein